MIDDDPGDPCLERRFTAKAIEVPKSRQIGHLNRVLGLFARAQNHAGEADGRHIVTLEQFGDSRVISAFSF
jgi:hypothetical protein